MTDRQLTTAAYITLGLLTSRDWSAYQLAEQVGRGIDHLWPRADRQRYITHKRLAEEGRSRHSDRTRRQAHPHHLFDHAGGSRGAGRLLAMDARPPLLEFEGMVRVMLSDQGSISTIFAGTSKTMRQQALAAHRDVRSFTRRPSPATSGTFPERQHLPRWRTASLSGTYEHIIEWATWALEQTESTGRIPRPRHRQRRCRSGRCSHRGSRCSPQSRRAGQPVKSGLRPPARRVRPRSG